MTLPNTFFDDFLVDEDEDDFYLDDIYIEVEYHETFTFYVDNTSHL